MHSVAISFPCYYLVYTVCDIFVIILLFFLGYGFFYKLQQAEINNTFSELETSTDTEAAGILSNSVSEYSDTHDIGIPLKTGQSEIIRISQEEFLTVTQEELTNYLNRRKQCKQHDWHAIVIDEDTAILCAYNQKTFVYGT